MLPNFTIRTGPTAEPISLAEAKLHCRIDSDIEDQDSQIGILIAAARRHAEKVTNRVLVTQGLRATLPCLPKQINLRAPLRKVTSITYLDTASTQQTLAPADYVVDPSELSGIVVPAYGACWPSTYIHPQSVKVDFIAGYATPFTVNPSTDIITAPGHPYSNGDTVPLSNSGGVLPAGLETKVDYYAVNVSGNTLQLSLTDGGGAIDVTSLGLGTHFLGVVEEEIRLAMLLLINHWYDNRKSVSDYQLHAVPIAADMLAHHKIYGL